MSFHCLRGVVGLLLFLVLGAKCPAASIGLTEIGGASVWERAEFRVVGMPLVTNPFDPDEVRLDAGFTSPSGRQWTVPGFYYQGYSRRLNGNSEVLTREGAGEWRVRFTPPESGAYSMVITVQTNGNVLNTASKSWIVPPPRSNAVSKGYVRVAPGGQYLETTVGDPIQLIGHNVCWHHARGTYDYDAWFASMAAAGENFARLWMWPNAFGLETRKDSLTRYAMDKAWQLDYVLELAEAKGIYILLCLDYHGMFEVEPDYWGGNNYWPTHPYNVTNGGPCLNQNAFFTSSTAQNLYQKRLRYLVGRYGYSPRLLAWEFFNEIDNVYSYLKPSDVVAWHRVMGGWLRNNDPFRHLITTSLTGSSDRSDIWTVPELDFAAYHSYGESSPASRMKEVAQSFLSRYRKPVMIGEFGTDWRGWNRENDPFLRGYRQILWGGALGGSLGSAMSWWWESIHGENLYPLFKSMRTVLNNTGWARGTWSNAIFRTSGPPPATVTSPIPGGEPFTAHLVPGGGWGSLPAGQLAVADEASAHYAAGRLNAFVHGSAHADLRRPFRLHAWLTNSARLVMHLNSVSQGANLLVRVDGAQILRTNLPNIDGAWNVNNEYNMDIGVDVPAGRKLIEISNAGSDWFYLDWVRLERVLPAAYTNNWQPSPEAIGMQKGSEALVYVVAPGTSFPAGATNANLPTQTGGTVTLSNWVSGKFLVDWFDPSTGAKLSTAAAVCTNDVLTLNLPAFKEDLAGVLLPPPTLKTSRLGTNGELLLELDGRAGLPYEIQLSTNLVDWQPRFYITNENHNFVVMGPEILTNSASGFFRGRSRTN